MKNEIGRKLTAAAEAASRYRVPLTVLAILAAAVGLDYAFRASDRDFHARGLDAMASRDFDGAVAHFSRALRQNPADPAARFSLGWAYHSKGWTDEALKQYELAIRAGARNLGAAFYNMGLIYLEQGRREDAKKQFQSAVAVDPGATGAKERLKALGG